MGRAQPDQVEVISYGGAEARIKRRGDGLFMVRWREARKGRSTTSATREGARKLARAKVRELAGKAGSRTVSVLEAEAVDGLKAVIGARSLPAVVEQLKDLVARVGGFQHVVRACENYIKAGHGRLDRSTVHEAVTRFLKLHERSAVLYRGGMRKELQAGALCFGAVSVCDLDAVMLEVFIARLNADGSEPGPRYFNNRLATWKTFMNRCREWGMLLRGEPHAGELVKRRKEPDSVPEIWSVELALKILGCVKKNLPASLPYLVTGCWMGCRPFEIQRLDGSMWDWERGYLDIGAKVAMKTMQQRFVPIPENVKALMKGREFRTITDDQVHLSKLLREKKL
ncbi:MAG: hypothetical protein Q8M07_32275, partial [Prosthecobacter sp.]|nr:hypothetical protein [Prosthecobacter sp.]